MRNGPRGFSLPADVVATRTIDQPNVVTFVFTAHDGPTVFDYLEANQRALGLTDVVAQNGSMTFRVDGWEGGFTTADQISGLTLRRQT